MSETTDLDTQIAQRLFGWDSHDGLWAEPSGPGDWCMHVTPPAYSTDPAQAALVWQWLETQRGRADWTLTFDYWLGTLSCRMATYNDGVTLAEEQGETWPEALCRAALALAAALAKGAGEEG